MRQLTEYEITKKQELANDCWKSINDLEKALKEMLRDAGKIRQQIKEQRNNHNALMLEVTSGQTDEDARLPF